MHHSSFVLTPCTTLIDAAQIRFSAVRSPRFWVGVYCTKWQILCYTVKLFRETATRRSFTNGCYTTQCIQVFCYRRCTSRTRFYLSWNCRASGMRKGFMNPTVLHGAIVGETCLALQFHENVSPCNIGFSKETQYLASILSDTFVKRICRNKGCAPGKRSLQTRWNVISTFIDTHVHGDERWPIMEVTSNTYFRGVTLFC